MARTHGQHTYKGFTIIKDRYGAYKVKKGWERIVFEDGKDRFSLFREAKAAIDKLSRHEASEKKEARMATYKFSNGDVVTTKLSKDEMLKRMRRLDILRVMTEGFSEGDGTDICRKALRAYDKTEDFTGIIRLSSAEKEFLSYMLEDEMLSSEEISIIRFYCGYTDKQWKEIISLNKHLANR